MHHQHRNLAVSFILASIYLSTVQQVVDASVPLHRILQMGSSPKKPSQSSTRRRLDDAAFAAFDECTDTVPLLMTEDKLGTGQCIQN